MFVNGDDLRQGSKRIALARIDAVVSARLWPARIRGNAQPAAFHRQVAMYLAHRVGGWSTTRIGRFYKGRNHSTVCNAIKRIQALRDSNAEVEGLLCSLIQELTPDQEQNSIRLRRHRPRRSLHDQWKASTEWIWRPVRSPCARLGASPPAGRCGVRGAIIKMMVDGPHLRSRACP